MSSEGGKRQGRTPKSPTQWRAEPRDGNAAREKFPARADFIAHMRATGRPTTRDLRKLRALKKTPAKLDPLPE